MWNWLSWLFLPKSLDDHLSELHERMGWTNPDWVWPIWTEKSEKKNPDNKDSV